MKFQTVVPGSVSLYVLLTYLTSTFQNFDEGEMSVWTFIVNAKPTDIGLRGLQYSMTQHVAFMAILTLVLLGAPSIVALIQKAKAKTRHQDSV